MLVVGMCSTKMNDSTTLSLKEKELQINVLGVRSAPSIPRERYGCENIT